MQRLAAILICLSLVVTSNAQDIDIIPNPVSYMPGRGSFLLNNKTVIVLNDEGEKRSADFFNHYIQKFHGIHLKVVDRNKRPATNFVLLSTRRYINKPENEERYTLDVTSKNVKVEGDSYRGTFLAMQTLLQVLPSTKVKKITIPVLHIEDSPRFGYRGMHLDVSRHFFPVEYIKRYIDLLALHKLNTFHWHLTDDQGWRIEIKKYPRLTEVGAYRNGTIIGRYPGKGNDGIRYGGFYTQEQIKDVVQYAANRFIDVIPEIEMPGHSSAAIAAYPQLSCFPLESTKAPAGTAWSGTTEGKQVQQAWGVFDDVYCAGNDETFTFLQNVVDEILPLFPSKYLHIGGDENPKGNWKRCPKCQRRMKENNLKNELELQSYFTQRMEKYINGQGKKIIGWDEILEGGLAPDATVMSWRGEDGAIEAAKQKHDAIMTPEAYLYFNWSQTRNEDSVSFGRYTPIEKTYSYDPVSKKLDSADARHILGAQGNLWTEYIKNTSILEYNLFPRMSALSELAWSPKEKRNYNDFEKRLMTQLKRYELWKVNYSKAYFEINFTVRPTINYDGLSINFSDYKFKNLVVVYKDSASIKQAVDGVYGSGGRNMVHTRVKVPFNDSLTINSSMPYYFIAGSKTSKKYDGQVKPLFTYEKKIQFAFNKATGKKITLQTPPSATYPGNGGAFGLVNGLSGKDFNAREWQGWYGKNMEAVIDLGKDDSISKVSIGVWSQEPSFIFLPKAVELYASADGDYWKKIADTNNTSTPWTNDRKISVQLPSIIRTRFVKVVVVNYGTIAKGRAGEGKASWLFVDEIEID